MTMVVAEIKGMDKLLARLQAEKAKADDSTKGAVYVGYTANYAIFVHENLEAKHPVGKAKFLEAPARAMRKELSENIKTAMRAGKTMLQSLLVAGRLLQRASQKLCPVDTGNLRGSAYTDFLVKPTTFPEQKKKD
jgi:hypothetical protein